MGQSQVTVGQEGPLEATWAKGPHSLPKTRLISTFDQIAQDFIWFEFRASPRMEISQRLSETCLRLSLLSSGRTCFFFLSLCFL